MVITLICAQSQILIGCSTTINTTLCRCTSIQRSWPLMNKLLKPTLELCRCLLAFAFIQIGKSNSDIAWAATRSAWHHTHLVLLHKPAHNCFIILTPCSMPHTHYSRKVCQLIVFRKIAQTEQSSPDNPETDLIPL